MTQLNLSYPQAGSPKVQVMKFNEQFTTSNAVVDFQKLSLNDFIFNVGMAADGKKNLSSYMIIPRKRGIAGVLDYTYLRTEADYVTDLQENIHFYPSYGAYRFLWSNEKPAAASLAQLNFSALVTFANSEDSSLANVDVGLADAAGERDVQDGVLQPAGERGAAAVLRVRA